MIVALLIQLFIAWSFNDVIASEAIYSLTAAIVWIASAYAQGRFGGLQARHSSHSERRRVVAEPVIGRAFLRALQPSGVFLFAVPYLCFFPSGIPTQVVVPSVSRAAVLHGTAFTVFVVSSGPTTSRPGPVSICGNAPVEYGVGVGLASGGLTNLSPVFPVGC